MDSVVATGSVQSHQTPVVVSENPASTANTTRPHATVVAVLGGCSPSSAPPRHSGVSVPDLSIPGSIQHHSTEGVTKLWNWNFQNGSIKSGIRPKTMEYARWRWLSESLEIRT
ncbi:Uncharacterized protein APZ42_031184 [Daphnia magna]|uniref:Uncharacterized protein n=1 Tax=Daphnia magna TaxID=35525 RepID=A0A164N260_9CRUS|nr:Uncharacterized protein APZ42_031184 [Daphnia magna]